MRRTFERRHRAGHHADSTHRRRRRIVRPRWAWWTALAGLAVVAAAAVPARGGHVPGWERQLFEAVNGLPGWLYRPAWVVQFAGVLGAPLVVAVVAAVFRKWRLAAALVLLVPLKLLVEKGVLKQLVDRQRPGTTEPEAILRHVPAAGNSFPSGHAIIVLAVATLVAPYLRGPWRAAVFALAALACLARVYLGAHNPLDVVAGAGAGLFLGSVLTLLVGVPVTHSPAPRSGPAGRP